MSGLTKNTKENLSINQYLCKNKVFVFKLYVLVVKRD
jgi:hypothetical protein